MKNNPKRRKTQDTSTSNRFIDNDNIIIFNDEYPSKRDEELLRNNPMKISTNDISMNNESNGHKKQKSIGQEKQLEEERNLMAKGSNKKNNNQ